MSDVPAYRRSDRDLDEPLAERVISEQFPDLAELPVRRWDEGWDNEVYLVGDDWVFRFPKRAGTVEWLERERQILELVARATDVAVPRFERFGQPSDAFPYPYVGYRRVPGSPADEVVLDDYGALAGDLGRALSEIHAIDTKLVPPTPSDWENEDPEAVLHELVKDAEWVRPYLRGAIADAAEPYLRGEVRRPLFDGERRFLHNDIGPDHVLVTPDGRLSGIIDFADAMVGDPVADFIGLVCVGGYAFVEDVVALYEHPLDDTFWDRLRWSSHVLYLRWLVDADDLDDEEDIAKHLRWVERAFADVTG